MGKIALLDQHITNLIAAGEVIERVSSVVKELVENAIDAGASIINVELEESGFRLIRVTDNGEGMDEDDIKASICPHATSKISSSNDLFSISSLGFRGEALPSIAAVSDLTIASSCGGNGTKIHFVDSKIEELEYCALPLGTTVEVRNLFYNTPARLQTLSNGASEVSNVSEYITKIALAYPEIAFKLTSSNKLLFQTFGSKELLEVIQNVYGVGIAKEMIEFTKESPFFAIEGYTSNLSVLRSTKSHITILINGRSIRNYYISNAIISAYENRLMISKYPICIINITCDYSLVDVNVHPAKAEVRFSMEKELCDLIKQTLTEVLSSSDLTVDAVIDNSKLREIKQVDPFDLFNSSSATSPIMKKIEVLENEKEELLEQIKKVDEIVRQKFETTIDDSLTIEEDKKVKILNLNFIGQLFDTYLLCQDSECFYLIDQHAAEERVNYERIKRIICEETIRSEELIVPFNFSFPINEALIIKENIDLLSSLGIAVEEFGDNSFVIRSIGTWIPKRVARGYLEEIFSSIIKGTKTKKEEFLDSLAKSIACKASIKANEYHSKVELEELLRLLSICHNPYTCPHGRPTIIKYSKYDIEKMFKRVI